MARSTGLQRLRGDESWIDVSLRSSSRSSVNDEIVTTGLRVHQAPPVRRRRRRASRDPSRTPDTQCTSSQDEYEESESEEDRVLTSSNEQLNQISPTGSPPVFDAESDSDNRGTTHIGRHLEARSSFTPQPNAFSHPPSHHLPSSRQSHFYPNLYGGGNHPYNSPVDHDAALRASLTTLLSIGAAAARGLPKREDPPTGLNQACNEPIGLRVVSEAEFMSTTSPSMPHTLQPQSSSPRTNKSSASDGAYLEKGKKRATVSEKAWALRKRHAELQDNVFPPTLSTWALSAGVLVLVSVVGFGAGYVIGREIGKQEMMAGFHDSALAGGKSCGKEAVSSSSSELRRFKWGISGGSKNVFM